MNTVPTTGLVAVHQTGIVIQGVAVVTGLEAFAAFGDIHA